MDLKKRYDLAEWGIRGVAEKDNPESASINQFFISSAYSWEKQPMQKSRRRNSQAYMNKNQRTKTRDYFTKNLFKDFGICGRRRGALRRGIFTTFAETGFIGSVPVFYIRKSGYYRYLLATALLAQGENMKRPHQTGANRL